MSMRSNTAMELDDRAQADDGQPDDGMIVRPIRLKSSGRRVVSFTGSLIGLASSRHAKARHWLELAIYRDVEGPFVATVKVANDDETTPDRQHVCQGATLDEFAQALEEHDPAAELATTAGTDDDNPAKAALAILSHRLQLADVRRQYADLIGETLFALEAE